MLLLPLRDGNKIPQIGLGTWLSKENEVGNAVSNTTFFFLSCPKKKIVA
jgi:diketogulonate reductase-like aldo/keto reductase